MDNTTISFKHSGNSGDIIYSLAGVRHVCGTLNRRAEFNMWLDREARYYEGAVHPLGNKTLDEYMYRMLKPLLEKQPYIAKVDKYLGQRIQVDLDLVRQRDIGMPNGNIAYWYGYIFPDMICDAAVPWIEAEDKYPELANTIIVNRTQRYQNAHISYSFLRRRKEDLMFVGTLTEFELVKREIPQLAYLDVDNFYDLACAIKSCKFFVGNQSMCFAIAEAMKTPRILEICSFAQNVIPCGPGPACHYHAQSAFEWFVEDLGKKRDLASPGSGPQMKIEFREEEASTISPSGPNDYATPFLKGIPATRSWEDNVNTICRSIYARGKSLVDFPRMERIAKFIKDTEALEGDVAEVGVYKGGTAFLIAALTDKPLHLFDTFKGMPKVSEHDLHHEGDFADTDAHEVNGFVSSARPGNNHISVNEGLFPESAWLVTERKFSFVHIDVDIYQSVKDCLEFFYPRMVKGGIIALDDVYEKNCPGALKAFQEFLSTLGYPVEDLGSCQSQIAIRK